MTRKPRTPDLSLYTLQQGAESFIITKFDSLGLEMLSQYIMPVIQGDNGEEVGCTCPQGQKPTCRHRKMLPDMLERIDTNWFYQYETARWINMNQIADAAAVDPESGLAESHEPMFVEDGDDAAEERLENPAWDGPKEPVETTVPTSPPVAPATHSIPRRRLT